MLFPIPGYGTFLNTITNYSDITVGFAPVIWTGIMNNTNRKLTMLDIRSYQEIQDTKSVLQGNGIGAVYDDNTNQRLEWVLLSNKVWQSVSTYTQPIKLITYWGYKYHGVTYYGNATLRVDFTKSDTNPPRLIDFFIFSNNKKQSFIAKNKINTFQFSADPVGGSFTNIKLGMSNNSGKTYTNIPVVNNNGMVSGNFDGSALGGDVITAKIELYDNSGNYLKEEVEVPFEYQCYLCADVDNNEKTNRADLDYLSNYIINNGPAPVGNRGDLNNDSIVDMTDLVYITDYFYYSGANPVCPSYCTRQINN
jgi:hypothetical protein